MTFIIIFLMSGFNILLSQQNCYNLDLAYKSWYRKDSIVSVDNNTDRFEMKINDKIIKNLYLNGKIVDLRIYDILGKNIDFTSKQNLHSIHLTIDNEIIKNKLILITFSIIYDKGIRYWTIKQYLD